MWNGLNAGMYGWMSAGIIAIILGSILWLADGKIDDLRERNAMLKVDIATIRKVNETNFKALKQCEAINQENTRSKAFAEQEAEDAKARVRELEIELGSIEVVANDTECRTLVDPLPTDFVLQLCLAANCGGD